MKIIKKNQLTILVLSLMLVTAGYLNYNNSVETGTEIAGIGDATLVSTNLSNGISNNTPNKVVDNNVNTNITTDENLEKAESTSVQNVQGEVATNIKENNVEEYFNVSRLERDKMYSQMLESYQKILDSKTTSDKQKEAAQKEIDNVNKIKNSIMISENLIKTKGFKDVIIFSNDDSISVVINKEELSKEDIAQIQSIIAREMNAKIEDIHIMNK